MTVGIVFIGFNDIKLLPSMYDSLLKTINKPVGMVAIDVGSTDGTREWFESKMMTLGPHNPDMLAQFGYKPDDMPHLSRCLNLGIKVLQSGCCDINQILWAHLDCDYWNNGNGANWLESLEKYLDDHKDVGKVAPETDPPGAQGERPGDQCPPMLTIQAIDALNKKYGEVYPEKYLYMHMEDWAIDRRLALVGYKTMIASTPVIRHDGMGSRKNSKNSKEINWAYGHNAKLYYDEFGTYDKLV